LPVTSRPAATQHLRDLAWLRRVRDRLDRDYAQPLDIEALARGAHLSAGSFSRRFIELVGVAPSGYRQATGATAGLPSCVANQATRPVRNREAPAPSRS
jgi:AraC-like DNA-binding protein